MTTKDRVNFLQIERKLMTRGKIIWTAAALVLAVPALSYAASKDGAYRQCEAEADSLKVGKLDRNETIISCMLASGYTVNDAVPGCQYPCGRSSLFQSQKVAATAALSGQCAPCDGEPRRWVVNGKRDRMRRSVVQRGRPVLRPIAPEIRTAATVPVPARRSLWLVARLR